MIPEITPPERHPKINPAAVRLEKAVSGQDIVRHSLTALSIPRSWDGAEGDERRCT